MKDKEGNIINGYWGEDGGYYETWDKMRAANTSYRQKERLIQEQEKANRLQEEYLRLLELQEEQEFENEIDNEIDNNTYYDNYLDDDIDYIKGPYKEDKEIELDREYLVKDKIEQFNSNIPENYKPYILATLYYLIKTNTKWLTTKLVNQIFSKRNLSNSEVQNILKYLNEDLQVTDNVGYFYGIGTDSNYAFERFYKRVNGQNYFEIKFIA